ncbi:hypothetical protein KW805_00365 [Candidatus Pacearchaeota archaeon]|nr:hypothetical protein [Candidatus Pacearchaeota archaeon]
MKLAPYIDKLNSSASYKDFMKKYKDSFMIAGFFILDLDQGKNIHQIDYFIPSQKKIAAFTLDGQVTVQILESMSKKAPEKMDIKTNIDLDELAGILEDEMKNRSITEEIRKVIAILQMNEGKKIWNLNCVLSGMSILRAHVDDESKTVLKMERSSIMDYMKKVSPDMLPQQQPEDKKGMEDQIGKLTKLEEQIEKEKTELQQKLNTALDKAQKESKFEKPAKVNKVAKTEKKKA